MRYFLFLDESGEANINNPDPRFNAFVLCGVLFREDAYRRFSAHMMEIKTAVFGDSDIVFHSYEMRAHKGRFSIFRDNQKLNFFYQEIEKLFRNHQYVVFASVINKSKYKEVYPEKNQAYEESLKFITERIIGYSRHRQLSEILVCIEKRNEGKNRYLKKYYTEFCRYGTEYISAHAYKIFNQKLFFKGKNDSIPGLEFADLCAYPIAWCELNPEKSHPTFELLKSKFHYGYGGKLIGYGLKKFP